MELYNIGIKSIEEEAKTLLKYAFTFYAET